MCVRACVRACVSACVRACVRACMCLLVCVCVFVYYYSRLIMCVCSLGAFLYKVTDVVFVNVAYIYSNFALCMNLDNFVKK